MKFFTFLTSCFCLFSAAVFAAGESDALRGKCGFFFRIDGLGWQAYQVGTSYATQAPAASSNANGLSSYPEFDFHAAFRFGGGYVTPCSGWALESYWTNYHQSVTSTENDDSISQLGPSSGALAGNANSKLTLQFNVFDLELSKTFCALPCFKWVPHFGVQGISLRQKQWVNYSGGDYIGSEEENTWKANFYGVGMTGGIGVIWDILECCGSWSILANSKLSLLTGKTFFNTNSHIPSTPAYRDIRYHHGEVRPIFDMSLGLRWANCYCNQFPLIFDLVWESLYLPNTIKWSSRENSHLAPGDLSFSGVTLSARLGF